MSSSLTLSFNPYWVFEFAATKGYYYELKTKEMFQSLLGFRVRCNGVTVSGLENHFVGFNPYWVFEFAATSLTVI